jgi:hypothetical protein
MFSDRRLAATVRVVPSLSHEALIVLFRNRPTLAAELLRDALDTRLPDFTSVRIGEADLTELVPTEYRADLVVLLERERGGEPAAAIIVETQLGRDADKRWSWPAYVCGLRARLRCNVMLLVVTVDEGVATWATTAIETGHPAFSLSPLVLGPSAVPVIRDVEEAERSPELAVLSVMAHGRADPDEAVQMATATFAACRKLDDARALVYSDLVFLSLGQTAKAALEALMASGQYEYQSDFAKKHRAEGRVEGEALSIVTVLEARGLPVTSEARARILACADLEILERWLRKAVSVSSADELFRD